MRNTLFLLMAFVPFAYGTSALDAPATTSPLPWTRYAIEGFAFPTSVAAGQTLRFYISVSDSGARGTEYSVAIYRVPDTAKILTTFPVRKGQFYPLHDSAGAPILPGDYARRPVDFRKGCAAAWESTAVSFTVPADWKSGLYYAQVEHQSPNVVNRQYYIPFIVRSRTPGASSNILFKFDLTTSQAYNYWGGGSLYSKAQDPSLTVSDSIAIDRPLWFPLSSTIKYGYANQFIKTLEDSGYTMEYCNNIDIDSLGLPFLSSYKTLVIWQHDEYWTQRERDLSEQFIGRMNSHLHNNIARFSANTCYWRVQWLNAGHRQLRCDKWWSGTAYERPSRFRYIDTKNPEGKFLGSQYDRYYNSEETEMSSDSIMVPTHWIFRGLGLRYGDTLGFGYIKNGRWVGMLGTELDNASQPNGRAPYPTVTLGRRYVLSHKDKTTTDRVLHEMVYYEDTTTNARVFGLGTMSLSAALYPCPGNDRTKIQQMIINIISHFSERRYIGNVYAPAAYPLIWKKDIRVDGAVRILSGRKLTLSGKPTVTLDSVLTVDGELEVFGQVTIAGGGGIRINPSGTLRIRSGSTLTLNGPSLVSQNAGGIIYENGSFLIDRKNAATVLQPDYSVIQNFPNPFNPTTLVRYGVAERSAVQLNIYNTLGQSIISIACGTRDPGYYEQNFDGTGLASGIYYYRIEAVPEGGGDRSLSSLRKMILLK